MSSYAERLATELRNRYEDHDRDGFERALKRMVDILSYAGPVPEPSAPGPDFTGEKVKNVEPPHAKGGQL